jgi:hypothetical protein
MTSEDFDEWSSHRGATNRVLLEWEGGEGGQPSPNVRHFDPYLMPASEQLRQATATMFADIEQHCPRPARQRSDARQRREAMVSTLVANFALLPEGGALAVSFRNSPTTRYDRAGFRVRTLHDIVTDLQARGWLDRAPGVAHQQRTLLIPRPMLHSMLAAASASASDVERLAGAESIILRAVSSEADRGKVLIDYSDNEETLRLRSEIETINQHLGSAKIALGGRLLPAPHVVRIFQIDAPDAPHVFTKFGRMYRGHWQTTKRVERHLLTINGERIAEADFKSLYLQLAYITQGLEPPPGDLYDLAGLEHHREGVKKAVSGLFFRNGPLRRLSPDLAKLLPAGWTGRKLHAAIAERHSAIAPLLGTNIGPRFQRLESDIAVDVMLRLAAEGVVALPLHDAFLCPASKLDSTVKAMQEVSRHHLGRVLPVETKTYASR